MRRTPAGAADTNDPTAATTMATVDVIGLGTPGVFVVVAVVLARLVLKRLVLKLTHRPALALVDVR